MLLPLCKIGTSVPTPWTVVGDGWHSGAFAARTTSEAGKKDSSKSSCTTNHTPWAVRAFFEIRDHRRANGGKLSGQQKEQINKAQNKTSSAICTAKLKTRALE
jgi:hypothetical protein